MREDNLFPERYDPGKYTAEEEPDTNEAVLENHCFLNYLLPPDASMHHVLLINVFNYFCAQSLYEQREFWVPFSTVRNVFGTPDMKAVKISAIADELHAMTTVNYWGDREHSEFEHRHLFASVNSERDPATNQKCIHMVGNDFTLKCLYMVGTPTFRRFQDIQKFSRPAQYFLYDFLLLYEGRAFDIEKDELTFHMKYGWGRQGGRPGAKYVAAFKIAETLKRASDQFKNLGVLYFTASHTGDKFHIIVGNRPEILQLPVTYAEHMAGAMIPERTGASTGIEAGAESIADFSFGTSEEKETTLRWEGKYKSCLSREQIILHWNELKDRAIPADLSLDVAAKKYEEIIDRCLSMDKYGGSRIDQYISRAIKSERLLMPPANTEQTGSSDYWVTQEREDLANLERLLNRWRLEDGDG